MPTRLLYSATFDTSVDIGTGTGNVQVSLPTIDLSRCDELEILVSVTKANTDAGDTLNIYLQNRWGDGIWNDRVSVHQFTGDMSPTATTPEVRRYSLQQFGTFSDTEEASEPSGSLGGTHLTAGSVLNGLFPPLYGSAGASNAAAWRIYYDQVNTSTSDSDFEGTIYIYGNDGVG